AYPPRRPRACSPGQGWLAGASQQSRGSRALRARRWQAPPTLVKQRGLPQVLQVPRVPTGQAGLRAGVGLLPV
ncbi:MAG: hypothetical protein ACKO3Q_03340, partial [Betaproteobacteria bacterium]